jgi:hypothetical protein
MLSRFPPLRFPFSSLWLSFTALMFVFAAFLFVLSLPMIFLHSRINDSEPTADTGRSADSLTDTLLSDNIRKVLLLRFEQTCLLVDPINTADISKTMLR